VSGRWLRSLLASLSESETALFQPNSPGLGSMGQALELLLLLLWCGGGGTPPPYTYACLLKMKMNERWFTKKEICTAETWFKKKEAINRVRGVRKEAAWSSWYWGGTWNELIWHVLNENIWKKKKTSKKKNFSKNDERWFRKRNLSRK
jgi:hypothetical protein